MAIKAAPETWCRVIRRQVEDPICTLLVEQVNGQVALVKAIDKDGKIEIVSA